MSSVPKVHPNSLKAALRCAGLGVAIVELVFLTCWMGMLLSLIGAPRAVLPLVGDWRMDSLPVLGAGMVLAATLGAFGGAVTAVGRNLLGVRASRPVAQDLAGSLTLRK